MKVKDLREIAKSNGLRVTATEERIIGTFFELRFLRMIARIYPIMNIYLLRKLRSQRVVLQLRFLRIIVRI